MTKPVLLMTRPAGKGEAFAAGLNPAIRRRVRVVIAPLLRIVPLYPQIDLRPYNGVIFTSASAVALAPPGGGCAAYCVGQVTALAAEKAGWSVLHVSDDAAHLIADFPSGATGPLLHLAGKHRRGDVAGQLTEQGQKTDVCVVYTQDLLPLTAEAIEVLASGTPVFAPIFSPRTAAHFIQEAPASANLTFIAMSPAVAQAIGPDAAEQVHTALRPTAESMSNLLEKLIG